MRTTISYKVWQIIYPIGIYYVVSSLAYFVLGMMLGDENETYMMRQLVCAAAAIPFVFTFYQQDQKARETIYGKEAFAWNIVWVRQVMLSIFSAAALGVSVNNLIAMTPLVQMSIGFQEANKAFFGGQVVYELLGSCLLIPIAEELLFRGVVYQRVRLWLGKKEALALSALIFGLVHANLVQFLYAGILGLLLAFLVEKTGRLQMAVFGHIAANTIAVFRQETGWLDFSYQPTVGGIAVTLLILVLAILAIRILLKEKEAKTNI